nr:ATP-binding protein [uncultured Dorea sp.]
MEKMTMVMWWIMNLIVFGIFIKEIAFSKKGGTIERTLFLCLCMVAVLFSWDEIFFEIEYPLRKKLAGFAVECIEHLGFYGLCISVIFMERRYGGKEGDNPKLLVLMGCFPVMSVIWNMEYKLYMDPSWTNQDYTKLAMYIGVVTWIMMILLNYLLCVLYYGIRKAQKERADQLLLLQQYEVEKRHYKDIEQMEKTVRGGRHDLNNLLATTQVLLEEEDYEGVRNLIQGTKDRVGESEKKLHTGNAAIDSILNLKFAKAKEAGIPVETDLSVPAHLDLNYEAMATIFGNLLDNALEAQEKIPQKERKVILRMKYMNQMLMILAANKGKKNPTLSTTKEDTEDHGFGIENIRRSVEKMGGSIQFSWEKDWFTAKIILYQMKEKSKNNI